METISELEFGRRRRPNRRYALKPPIPTRTKQPAGISLEEWQIALRRNFGREQKFVLKNLGPNPVFSEFQVTNPQSGGSYRILIRGVKTGDNHCSCPDFAVNMLGTCKHIEFTLARLGQSRLGKAHLAKGFRPPYSEVYLRYSGKRDVAFRPGEACPESLMKLARRYFGADGILNPPAYGRFETFLKGAQRTNHELHCHEEAVGFIAQVRDDTRRRNLIDKAFPRGIESPAFDHLLKVPLYAYQREGSLFSANAGRSLNADDMGLGKTVEAIAAAEILARTVGLERVLVVTPTSLKHQWKQEIEKFSERNADVVEGSLALRADRYRAQTFYKITNYDVINRDLELIHRWAPELIILDEAQRIKNWKTRTAQSVKKLKSEYALVLTGTPLENRLEELHSIVQFVDRFRLGPLFRFLHAHQTLDEFGKVIGYRDLSKIAQTLKPVLIRRNKREVLSQLPARLDKHFFVPMTKEQMQHHEENGDTVARVVAKWRRSGFLSETDQRLLMIALQNMRMSCNSTYLLDQKTDFGVKADELMDMLSEMFERPDTKVVIFSQWVRTHEVLARRLDVKKWKYILFHGGIPGIHRKDLIRRFKEEADCRLFLSTDAGGVGLNLQNASVVVNMDQPWNPAVLEQRIGRVHRLGQHRPIRVVNFVSQGTIEHGMLSLLSFKKSMFAGVLDGGENEVFLGGSRLKRFMDSVEQVSSGIPAPMPEAEKIVESYEAGATAAEQPTASPAGGGPLVQGAELDREAWGKVLSTGADLLSRLGEILKAPLDEAPRSQPALTFAKDEATGETYLKLPVPSAETLKKFTEFLGTLTGGG